MKAAKVEATVGKEPPAEEEHQGEDAYQSKHPEPTQPTEAKIGGWARQREVSPTALSLP